MTWFWRLMPSANVSPSALNRSGRIPSQRIWPSTRRAALSKARCSRSNLRVSPTISQRGVEGYIRTSELSRDPVDDPKKPIREEEETALEAYGASGYRCDDNQ